MRLSERRSAPVVVANRCAPTRKVLSPDVIRAIYKLYGEDGRRRFPNGSECNNPRRIRDRFPNPKGEPTAPPSPSKGVSRSEDVTQDNVELAVWSTGNVHDRTVLHFAPSHERNLAAQLLESVQALEEESPAR